MNLLSTIFFNMFLESVIRQDINPLSMQMTFRTERHTFLKKKIKNCNESSATEVVKIQRIHWMENVSRMSDDRTQKQVIYDKIAEKKWKNSTFTCDKSFFFNHGKYFLVLQPRIRKSLNTSMKQKTNATDKIWLPSRLLAG